MHQMSTDKIASYLQELCRMDRFGGRCIRLNNDTWEILDVSQWTEGQTQSLRARYPSLSAKIIANRSSLSGFSILIRFNRASVVWTSITVSVILIATITAIARTVAVSI